MTIPENPVRLPRARWIRLALVLVAILVLAVSLALLAPRLFDLEGARRAITIQIEKRLGRRVTLGALSFRLFPTIEVRASEVKIAEDPAFDTGEFVTARTVRLEVGIWSLLRGSPQLRGLELDSPTIVLIRRPGATAPDWNWRTLQPLREPKGGAEQGAFDLIVRGGRFTMIDRMVDPPVEALYEGIDIKLDGFTPREVFSLAAGVDMPGLDGQPGGRLELNGRVGPLDPSNPAATPIEARVTLGGVGIAALETLIGNPRSGRTGRLTLEARLAGRLTEQLSIVGTLRADELRLTTTEGVAPSRIPLEIKYGLAATLPVEGRAALLRIEQAEVALGTTRLRASGQVELPPNPQDSPALDLKVDGQGVVLESLLESASALGFGPPSGTKAAGTANLQLQLRREFADPLVPSFIGELEIRGLRLESGALPEPVEVTGLKLTASPQELSLAPFQTALGARSALAISRLVLTDYRTSPMLKLEARTEAARIEDLLKVAESFGLRPDLKGSGLITVSVGIEASVNPKPALTRLSGRGSISSARLETSSLTRPLSITGVDLAFTGNTARFEKLAATIGSSTIAGTAEVVDLSRPRIGFNLRVDRLSVPEIRSLIKESRGQVAAAPPATALSAAGQLSVGQLNLDGLTASNVEARIGWQNGVLTLDPLSLALYGGAWRGAVRFDQRTAAVALKGRLTGVEVNQLLAGAGRKTPLSGRLDGQIDLRGNNTGGEGGGLLNSLSGNAQVSISDGKIASFDLMKQVETIGRFVNLPTGGAATAFRNLRTNLRFEPGVMRTDALQVTMADLSASGEGLIRFGEPLEIDYSILARLSPELTRRILTGRPGDPAALRPESSPRTPVAGGISQLVGTFFTERDSLVIPLRVSGPVTGPRFGLDAETLRRRLTGSVIDNLRQKIPGLTGDKPASPADGNRKPSPTDAIRGILDRFKKKKPGDQP